MKRALFAAVLLLAPPLFASARASEASVAPIVAPVHSKGSIIHYPRLTAFPSAAIMSRANAILAAREAGWNKGRADCMASIADQAPDQRPPGDQSYFETVDVRYVSPHYLSLDIRESQDCGSWQPDDNESNPLTIDLATGKPVEWQMLFAKGFFPDAQNPGNGPSLLTLYQARYAKQGGAANPDCKRVIAEELSGVNVWLDAKKGLMVRPQLLYVVSACADVIAFTPAELDRYIASEDFRRDFDATVHR